MFGLSMTEIILIVIVALIVIGPKKLPDIAKSIGKGYGEFRRTFNDLKQSVNVDMSQTSTSSNQNTQANSSETPKNNTTETYKSQWEQKLPPAQVGGASNNSSSAAQAGTEEKRA